jgi:replicative DNA helicase
VGIPFGIEELDSMTTGIRQGEYVVLGGYPGSGKTAFLAKVLLDAARNDIPAAMFSIEMKDLAVAKRALAQYTNVAASHLRNPIHLSKADLYTLEQSIGMMKQFPLIVDDKCGQDVLEIVARARLYIHKYKVGIIGVDYLQMLSHGDSWDRKDEVGRASQYLCDLAKQTGVPVVAVSQLSRPENKDPNFKPNLFMLRDSGKIEQNAHLVVFTYRPVDDRGKPNGEDLLILGKQREGTIGEVPAYYDPRSLRWEERPTEKEIPVTENMFEGNTKSKKGKKGGKADVKNVGSDQGATAQDKSESQGTGPEGTKDSGSGN